jgi:hypothetical protein
MKVKVTQQGQAKKRNPHTRWGKSSNEALISEMLAPEDVRTPYHKLAYGEKNSYWEGIALGMKSRPDDFPGESYPSAKTCSGQFDILMQAHRDHHVNHQFKSGTTEDVNELASGLQEIMEEIDRVKDEEAADEEMKQGLETDAMIQENQLKRGRSTPKAKKNAIPESVITPQVRTQFDSFL